MRAACFAAIGLIALAASSAEAGTTSTTDLTTWATSVVQFVGGNFFGIPTPYGSGDQMFGGYNPLSGYSDLEGVSFSTPIWTATSTSTPLVSTGSTIGPLPTP